MLVGDIEANLKDDDSWEFKVGVIFDGYEYVTCLSVYEMMTVIKKKLSKISPKIVYFHNLDYDGLFFLQDNDVLKGVEDTKLIQSGHKIISFKLHKVEFRDTFVLLPMSLKKIVKNFLKIEDKDWEQDKDNVLTIDNEQLIEYCKKDCYYLYQAIIKFWGDVSEYEVGNTLTIPSLAYKIFKTHYVPKDVLRLWNRHNFFDVSYYYGGHTEKFVNNQYVFRHVYYYDVNSLYPAIMNELRIHREPLYDIRPSKEKLLKLINEDIPFYCELRVNIDSELLRFFPQRNEKELRNLYTFGEQNIKVSELGVKFILEYGSIDNIISVLRILTTIKKNAWCKPFSKFVLDFYSKRFNSEANSIVYKLCLNGLSGKFGEREDRWVYILNNTKRDDTPSFISQLSPGNFISKHSENNNQNKERRRFDIIGKITEGARLLMGSYINQIRLKGYEVYYTDTDSIFTNCCLERVFPEWLSEQQLGLFKNELGPQVKDDVYLLGQKLYMFRKHSKHASKGVKRITLDDFRAIIRREHKGFIQQRFSKLSKFVHTGFFGIMEVPHLLQNIRERSDR